MALQQHHRCTTPQHHATPPAHSCSSRWLAGGTRLAASARRLAGSQCCGAASRSSSQQSVLVELDACVQGLEAVTTAWAFAAAQAITADPLAGAPGTVYTRYMQQLLPVIQQPHEAALMLRLLHEEGIVGARSTAGRQGPVVGRPVRQSGSRPLLLNEVIEHWADEILPTCLLRWSRQAGCSPAELEARVAAAYKEAQRSVQWEVLDLQQRQHGSSSSSSLGCSSPPSAAATMAAGGGSSTAAAATVQCLAPAPAAAAISLTVQPFASVVASLRDCSAPVLIASHYPQQLTEAVLSAVQLQRVQVLSGSTVQHSLHQLLRQRGAAGASSSISVDGSGSLQPPQVLVLLSSPSRRPHWQLPGEQQQQPEVSVQVAEWACKAPSLRARALSSRGVGLLSEWGLAELLGVDSSDAVMDGIAWRS